MNYKMFGAVGDGESDDGVRSSWPMNTPVNTFETEVDASGDVHSRSLSFALVS